MNTALNDRYVADFPKHCYLLQAASSDRVWVGFRGKRIEGFFDNVSGAWFWKLENKYLAHILEGPRELTDTFRRLTLMAK